jgi:hypothetical protein
MKTILVNNGNLGRMGKTTLAYTIYKQSKEQFKYVTNDLENASIDLTANVDKDYLFHFPNGSDINMELNDNDNVIFDFGGKPDQNLLGVAKFVDQIIVPIAYQSDSELTLTVRNLNTLIEINKNIILVINNTDKEDAERIKTALRFNPAFSSIEILTINHSKYIRRLANEDLTVFDVANAKRADRTRLAKLIIPQFKQLFKALTIEIKA